MESYFINIMNEIQGSDTKKVEEPHDIFKLPICFSDKVKILKEDIITDLELKQTNVNVISESLDESLSDKPIYNHIFNPTNSLGNQILEILPSYYTTDVQFLKDNKF